MRSDSRWFRLRSTASRRCLTESFWKRATLTLHKPWLLIKLQINTPRNHTMRHGYCMQEQCNRPAIFIKHTVSCTYMSLRSLRNNCPLANGRLVRSLTKRRWTIADTRCGATVLTTVNEPKTPFSVARITHLLKQLQLLETELPNFPDSAPLLQIARRLRRDTSIRWAVETILQCSIRIRQRRIVS